MEKPLSEIRREYTRYVLDKEHVNANPFNQFSRWFHEAVVAKLPEPNAMTLATAGRDGMPSARIVLLKGFDETGFVFYTNYLSRKGRQLAENPHAALVFYWLELERQVRIEGTVTQVSRAESETYFRSRPLGSRLGALASRQSQVADNRKVLEKRFEEFGAQYADGNVPMPEHWGGYRLAPLMVEFWQGRESRLHDRLCYTRQEQGDWLIERLEP